MENMIRIAVVDDEEVFVQTIANRIRVILNNANVNFELQSFTNGTALLEKCNCSHFNLVFLDIDMPEVTGIDIAQKIRMKQSDTEMVFVTNKDDLVYDAIRYTPFRFIRKSRFEMEIEEALENYLAKRQNQKISYLFSTEQGKRPINVIGVLYIEVQSHKLTIHQQEGVFIANGNLSDVEKEITKYGFIRIHKSFLVNFRCINLINQREVILDDGTALPLSRGKLEIAKMELMRFLRGI